MALNIGSAPWMLIQGSMLRTVASLRGSGNPITMVRADYPDMLLVHVRATGAVDVDGKVRTVAQLRDDLAALDERGGMVQYSRDDPDREPSGPVGDATKAVLDLVTSLGLPVQFVHEVTSAEVADARDASGPT